MLKKTSLRLLIVWALIAPFQLFFNIWGCDGALLKDEVQECYTKISRGKFLDKKYLVDSLKFLYDETDYSHFKYENFSKAQENFKGISVKVDEPYHSFATICGEIYENGNERQKTAISILFKNVSNEYFSYYHGLRQRMQAKNCINISSKSTECNYHSLIYTLELVKLIESFPTDIKLFIDLTLIGLVEKEYPCLKRELLRCLLLNGKPLSAMSMEKISNKAFCFIAGIKRITFEKMVTIVQEVWDSKKESVERKNKVSAANILLMAIEYFGGYETPTILINSYGLNPTTVYRHIKAVDNIFANVLKLNLPEIFGKKRTIADDLINKSIDELGK
ncbi:hypothetical protein H0X06_01725 [Candidatus Dependentiae bacterium]|nr:hypothetical protein [Candidatus Dependentiae bacterium]